MTEDKNVSKELMQDLASKSLEELIFINFNQEEYVFNFTQKYRNQNIELLKEVNDLADKTETLRSEYSQIKSQMDQQKDEFEKKEKEYNALLKEKEEIDKVIK